MEKNSFAKKIVDWYNDNKRPLPWRETTDPYKIWLSEIILQQTRVSQGLPYYEKFVQHFPNVTTLACATEREVLRLWQGLGYYTRARNLHRCAKVIVHQWKGKFPDNFADLLTLPGIGTYTAAAIASMAFKEQVAVVDGNVFRVLSRVFGMENDIASNTGKEIFFKKAQSLIPKKDPDEFNQAIMEFGALHCVPQNPKCEECVFKKSCIAYANDWQDRLPVKIKKTKSRNRYFYYFVIEQNKKWGMQERLEGDIWQGLYDFYLLETSRPQNPKSLFRKDPLLRSLGGQIQPSEISTTYRHVLSHQKLFARFVSIKLDSTSSKKEPFKTSRLRFYTAKAIHKLPKPVLLSRYLQEKVFL